MNKRIDDLMYESGLTAQGCWDSMDKYDQEAIMKFAELIVKECANLFENVYTDQQRPERIDTRIKQHFGVEE